MLDPLPLTLYHVRSVGHSIVTQGCVTFLHLRPLQKGRNTLAAKQHLFKWLEFIHTNSDNLSQIGFDAGILADQDSSNSVAKWGYNNANAGGSKAWVKSAQYETVDASYLSLWT